MATFAVAESLAPVRQAANLGERLQMVATWLFVLPLFTEGIAKDVVKIEIAGLAVLAFFSIVIPRPLRTLLARVLQ
jgi:hypothetical protein